MSQKIRVGIAGVGNNASALVQGVHLYSQPEWADAATQQRHGILFPQLCGYEIKDVECSVAFDVDARKIGLDLGAAILSEPNCYPRVMTEDLKTGTMVQPSPVLDGIPAFLADMVEVAPECAVEKGDGHFKGCVEAIRRSQTDVLINFLPSGSIQASQFFARVAAAAGASYINCTPAPVVHCPELVKLFQEAQRPLLGDDLESQFGSSLIHRTLLSVLKERGLELGHSYQVNLGGNTDFKNLSFRSDAKKTAKMKAISPAAGTGTIDILPSGGFAPGLGDNKVGYIFIEGRGWLNTMVTIDLKLGVQDSSNAAGVTIDLVRIARGAMDRGLGGYLPLSYYFKNPLAEKLDTTQALAAIRRFNQRE